LNKIMRIILQTLQGES